MFTASQSATGRGRRSLPISIALHGLLLVWILHPVRAKFLAPTSVAFGHNGSSSTLLYWPTRAGDSSESGSAAHESSARERRLIWQKAEHAKSAHPAPAKAAAEDNQSLASRSGAPGLAAGTPHGSGGAASGDEIRPALPVHAFDPVVDPKDLPGHVEGSIIVEITIDENGTIVQKTVLQSLGPAIDNKVLAALEQWHFRPATRNGVAIPSKQDVYYHFKPEG